MNQFIQIAKDFLFQRKRAYVTTFRNPIGEQVLADLSRFCRADKSTFHADSHMAARLDGRREVWLRIAGHLNMTEDELWKIYSRPNAEK